MTRTLPLHAIPAARMKKLTDKARHDSFKAKLQRWVERNIVADDPEPWRQPSEGIHPIAFLVFVLTGAAFYLVAGWWIFHN